MVEVVKAVNLIEAVEKLNKKLKETGFVIDQLIPVVTEKDAQLLVIYK
jgi:hypothetical protein